MTTTEFSIRDHVLGAKIKNELGRFSLGAFEVIFQGEIFHHLLIYKGFTAPVPLRIQSACLTGHVAGDRSCECRAQTAAAMEYLNARTNGIIIYTPEHEARGKGLVSKLRVHKYRKERALDSFQACRELGLAFDQRSFDQFPHLLHHLDISTIVMLSKNKRKIAALMKGGIDVRATVALP